MIDSCVKPAWLIIPLASLLALACERKEAAPTAPTAPATEEGAAVDPVLPELGDFDLAVIQPSERTLYNAQLAILTASSPYVAMSAINQKAWKRLLDLTVSLAAREPVGSTTRALIFSSFLPRVVSAGGASDPVEVLANATKVYRAINSVQSYVKGSAADSLAARLSLLSSLSTTPLTGPEFAAAATEAASLAISVRKLTAVQQNAVAASFVAAPTSADRANVLNLLTKIDSTRLPADKLNLVQFASGFAEIPAENKTVYSQLIQTVAATNDSRQIATRLSQTQAALPAPASGQTPTFAQRLVAEVSNPNSTISLPGIGIVRIPPVYTLTASLAAPTLSPNANNADCDISAVASATASSNLTNLTYGGSFLDPASAVLSSAASSSSLTATLPVGTESGSYLLNWGVTATLPNSTLMTANASPRSFSLLREAPTTLVARTPAATIAGNTQPGRQVPFLAGPGQCAQSSATQSYASVSAGGAHSCAGSRTGGVVCWGLNGSGQLGNNSMISSTVPVAVSFATADVAVSVSAGNNQSCALLTTGGVKCWGNQRKFGLSSLTPVAIMDNPSTPLTNAVAIAAGIQHSCALLSGGGIKCWGSNGNGRLGTGFMTPTASNIPLPVDLGVGSTAVAIAAAFEHSCALLSGGQIKCWGVNSSGQLGTGIMPPTLSSSATPLQVDLGTSTAVSVAVSAGNSCALLSDGGIKCWGTNSYGRLGTGDTTSTPSATPLAVALNGSTAVSVAVGSAYSCALLSSGGVKCWGAIRLAGDTFATAVATPAAVDLGVGSTAVSIAVGDNHSCALLAGGGIKCWGSNGHGQLGSDGQLSSSAVFGAPLDVLPLGGPTNPASYLSGQSLPVWLMSILSP